VKLSCIEDKVRMAQWRWSTNIWLNTRRRSIARKGVDGLTGRMQAAASYDSNMEEKKARSSMPTTEPNFQ
jgi:hypothetical protein